VHPHQGNSPRPVGSPLIKADAHNLIPWENYKEVEGSYSWAKRDAEQGLRIYDNLSHFGARLGDGPPASPRSQR